MKKFLALMMAGALTLGLLTACGGSEPAPAPAPGGDDGAVVLKIGGIGPTTGGAAIYGQACDWAAQVAVAEINAMQDEFVLELNFQDDEHDAEKSVNAFHNLQDWDVDVIYGCTTSAPCVAVAGETYAERYFQLTPSATSTDVTAGRDNMFQLCFTDPGQGVTAAKYISENGMGTKVAIIYNNADAYSTGIYEAFVAEAPNQGLEIVSTTTFSDDNNPDFSVQIREAKDAGAELVFLPIYYTPASNILKQAKDMGYAPAFFGCDGMDGILTLEGFDLSLAEGLTFITGFNPYSDNEKTVAFIDSFKKLSGDVVPNMFGAAGYDCIYAIYEAAKKAGVTNEMTHEEICEAMIAVFTDASFSVDGLTGNGMTWGTNGEVTKAPMVVEIQGGAYVQK